MWVLIGKVPEIEFESERVKKHVYPHEIEQAKRLSAHGIKCIFQQDYEVDEKTGCRRGKPDLENGVELKSLTNTTNLCGRIDKSLKNAAKKKGFRCCHFDAFDTDFTDREITEVLTKEMQLRNIKRTSFIGQDGVFHSLVI